MNVATQPTFRTALASNNDMLRAAQALRYDVFVRELGAEGPLVDHALGIERDAYDEVCDHFLLFDDAIGRVVGVYRLIREEQAAEVGRFYSEVEFDLDRIKSSGRPLLELGRSCLLPEYRGSAAMYHLWSGLAKYVDEHQIGIMFGVASFPGTNTEHLAGPLSLLHQRHLADASIRPVARADHRVDMNIHADGAFDRRQAMLEVPALIKGYLRLGGAVGEGAWIDHAFNTTDVCLVMDTAKLNMRQRQIYTGAA